jgi:hypothetical protein
MADGRGGFSSDQRSRVIRLCETLWEKSDYKQNCSAFVKAVAAELQIPLSGQANDIYEHIQKAPWTYCGEGGHGSVVAGITASEGKFVVGASQDLPNGHVAIMVDYSNKSSRAKAYWGRLPGPGLTEEQRSNVTGKRYANSTESWGPKRKVIYAAIEIPG